MSCKLTKTSQTRFLADDYIECYGKNAVIPIPNKVFGDAWGSKIVTGFF